MKSLNEEDDPSAAYRCWDGRKRLHRLSVAIHWQLVMSQKQLMKDVDMLPYISLPMWPLAHKDILQTG